MREPEIIYEDQEVLVVYKPAGIAVQTKRLGQQDMETILKNYRAGKKETPYIGTVHRLDQPVEGIMVFGKNPKATASLSAQIREQKTGKFYYAIGRQQGTGTGSFPGIPESGTLTDYLGFDSRKNLGYFSSADDKTAKKSVLSYKIAGKKTERGEICFCIHLYTGRHHQIRLQIAKLGYPLAGDTKYGSAQSGNGRTAALPKENLALCACKISFYHPSSGKYMSYYRKPGNPLFSGYSLEEPQ